MANAEFHSHPSMNRFRIPSARRSRTLPEDSVWYRSLQDVPKYEQSDAVIEWCAQNWGKPWLQANGEGWASHDAKARGGVYPTGYYLDEHKPPNMPPNRQIFLNSSGGTGRSTEAANASANNFYHRFPSAGSSDWPASFAPAPLRVEGGVAGDSQGWTSLGVFGDRQPFGRQFVPDSGKGLDAHTALIWPTLRCSTESILTTWNEFTGVFTVQSFVRRPFDSNKVPFFPTGGPAITNGGGVPITSLIVTYDELARGWINHTLAFVAERYSGQNHDQIYASTPRWPATHSDGEDRWTGGTSTTGIVPSAIGVGGPFAGQIFRLRQDSYPMQNLDKYSPMQQVLLRALRDYGMVLFDKHGPSGGSAGSIMPPKLAIANDARFGADDFNLPTPTYPPQGQGNTPVSIPPEAIHITNFEVVDLDPRPTLNPIADGTYPKGERIMVNPHSWMVTEEPIQDEGVKLAVIGDLGTRFAMGEIVGNMVQGWLPDYVVSAGNQVSLDVTEPQSGSSVPPYTGLAAYDFTIGRIFHHLIKGAATGFYLKDGGEADVNRFFPCPGDRDWTALSSGSPSLNFYNSFFPLPYTGHSSTSPTNNKAYYDVVLENGLVNIFVIDVTGMTMSTSYATTVRTWLQNALTSSTAKFKIVVMNGAAYSNSLTSSTSASLQMPPAGPLNLINWGADLIIQGNHRMYERFDHAGSSSKYVTVGNSGIGGLHSIRSTLLDYSSVNLTSIKRIAKYGASLITITDNSVLTFKSITFEGDEFDTFTITKN
jgi:hypothetical protein